MKSLADVTSGDAALFGGKAVGLGRLIALGARVPEGFAVEATADPPEVWPPAHRDELRRQAKALLDRGTVAVRSSAPGEDSRERSFAGLFETTLGVADDDDLLAAARRCIASGASERVRTYAATAGPHRVGLVVQAQVAARSAGVCFTVDPTGHDRAVLVEAVSGLGDALVSGRAQPEAWRVYRSGLGGWEAQRRSGDGPSVLTPEEAIAIAAEAASLADRMGGPLDLEWAKDAAGALWWLQARPITAAAPVRPLDIERYYTLVDDGPVAVWANWNVREVMPEPFTHLNWSLWRDVVLPVVIEDVFGVHRSSRLFPHIAGIDLVGGRIYWNMNAMIAGPMGALFMGGGLAHLDARAAEVTRTLMAAGVLRPRRLPVSTLRAFAPFLWSALRSMARLGGALRPRHALRALEECGRRIASRPPVVSLSDPELLREMELLGAPESLPFRHGMQLLTTSFVFSWIATRVFRAHPKVQRLLTSGIENNPTTRISLDIDALAEAALPLAAAFEAPLSTPALVARLEATPEGVSWLSRLREVLARCGQRCPNEFDIATPRWTEDPTMILDLVRATLRAPPAERARERLARMARERREAIEEAAARASWLSRPVLRAAARLVALYAPLREAPKHHTMFVFQRMRMAALELGARLVARARIDTRDDVMFLDLREIPAALGEGSCADLRPLVADRRTRHEAHRAQKAPHFVRSDGVPVAEAAPQAAADGSLLGVGVSSGSATGPVRVLHAPDPRAMNDGDVIVMEFADPGWTPLFPRAAAVVMEVGGAMCHAAVVARELGIPAVFGVAQATTRLADGQRVKVDGESGTVSRSVEPAPATRRADAVSS